MILVDEVVANNDIRLPTPPFNAEEMNISEAKNNNTKRITSCIRLFYRNHYRPSFIIRSLVCIIIIITTTTTIQWSPLPSSLPPYYADI